MTDTHMTQERIDLSAFFVITYIKPVGPDDQEAYRDAFNKKAAIQDALRRLEETIRQHSGKCVMKVEWTRDIEHGRPEE